MKNKLPVIVLYDRDIGVFPRIVYNIEFNRPDSISIVHKILQLGGKAIIVAQKTSTSDVSDTKKLHRFGTEIVIKKSIDAPHNSSVIITAMGINRVAISRYLKNKDNEINFATYTIVNDDFKNVNQDTFEAVSNIKDLLDYYDLTQLMTEEDLPTSERELIEFIDKLAIDLPLTTMERINVIKESDVNIRAGIVVQNGFELISRVEEELENYDEMAQDVDEYEEEYEDVQDQLALEDIARIEKEYKEKDMPDDIIEEFQKELYRMRQMQSGSTEISISQTWLDTLLSLPWVEKTEENLNLKKSKKILNEDHYGLAEVKDRLLEYIAVRNHATEAANPILCFAGSPGVGKTSFGQSVARALGRKFIRISLGGVSDESEIRGHRRTYIGAMPGKIIQNLTRVKVRNPVFILDELDKMLEHYRGDPSSALLEVLDPEQNENFVDHYVGLPFSLKDVLFIATVNDLSKLHPALKDRMEIIELPDYSIYDKLHIAKKHLIPKQLKLHNLNKKNIKFTNNAIRTIIDKYTSEPGVRNLERRCAAILRKFIANNSNQIDSEFTIDSNYIKTSLGVPKIVPEEKLDNPEIGVTTGLAWSSYGGGSLMFIESLLTNEANGKLTLTGNLGKVLQESVNIIHSWIKSNKRTLQIDKDIIKQNIHVHLPDGSTPKDGPSAGIAIAVSIISSMRKVPVRNDIAMTGEVTLRGRVKEIGKVREKILAAHRAGIFNVIIPKENEKDLEELPEEVKKEITIFPVTELGDALKLVFKEE